MPDILVRNLDGAVVDRLKDNAKRRGRSLQAEAKAILERAANEPRTDIESARKLIRKIRRRFKGRDFPDAVALVREDRDR